MGNNNFVNKNLVKILEKHNLLMGVYNKHGENGLRRLTIELGVIEKYAINNNIFDLVKMLLMFEHAVIENAINFGEFKNDDGLLMVQRIILDCEYELVNMETNDHAGANNWDELREWVNELIENGTNPNSIIRLA